jgi:hypothetical protein
MLTYVGKRMTREELKTIVPLFEWDAFFDGIGMQDVGLANGPQVRSLLALLVQQYKY